MDGFKLVQTCKSQNTARVLSAFDNHQNKNTVFYAGVVFGRYEYKMKAYYSEIAFTGVLISP
jgi:hypothetical protein